MFSSAASCTPAIVCSATADSAQLHAYGYGGSGTFTYSWTAIPAGFTSTLQKPKVKPLQTTKYVAVTSDGTAIRHDTTEMRIVPAPTAFAGNDTIVCWYVSPIPVNATATGYLRFLWGSTGDGVFTDPSSLTTAYIPGIRDKTSGSADLKLIVWPLAPCMTKATSMMHITLDPCTGIAEQPGREPGMVVQPNPAHDKVLVTVTGLQHEALLTLTGLEGRQVYSVTILPDGKEKVTRQLDVSSYPKGMYLMKLQTANQVSVTRFIVQ